MGVQGKNFFDSLEEMFVEAVRRAESTKEREVATGAYQHAAVFFRALSDQALIADKEMSHYRTLGQIKGAATVMALVAALITTEHGDETALKDRLTKLAEDALPVAKMFSSAMGDYHEHVAKHLDETRPM